MPSISSPRTAPVRLAIVGDGPAAAALQERAAHVNRRWGREVVKFVGPMHDPRPAYAAADVVLGMGSSALRALSIGRPVVVQGEDGFSKVFEPATLPYFCAHGMWGRCRGGLDRTTACRSAVGPARRIRVAAQSSARSDAVRSRIASRCRAPSARSWRSTPRCWREVVERVLPTQRPPHGRAVRVELDNHDPRQKRARRRYGAVAALRGEPAGRPCRTRLNHRTRRRLASPGPATGTGSSSSAGPTAGMP